MLLVLLLLCVICYEMYKCILMYSLNYRVEGEEEGDVDFWNFWCFVIVVVFW